MDAALGGSAQVRDPSTGFKGESPTRRGSCQSAASDFDGKFDPLLSGCSVDSRIETASRFVAPPDTRAHGTRLHMSGERMYGVD